MKADPAIDPTEQRVRRALQELSAPINTTPPPLNVVPLVGIGTVHTRRRFIAAGALVGFAAATSAAFVFAADDDDPGVVTGSDPSPTTTGAVDAGTPNSLASPVVSTGLTGARWADSLAAGDVRTLPPAPIEGRAGPAAVWTGSEMLVWGGSALVATGERPISDGAAFSPTTGTWRTLAEAPIEGRSYPAVAWTGEEMIVWGGSQNGNLVGDGAAYDPTTDTWRTLAAAPIPPAMKSAVAWTGNEMVIVGGLNGDGAAASYNPSSDTWRRLADAPGNVTPPYAFAVWTGIVVLVPLTNGESQQAVLASYDPAANTWTSLDGLPSQFIIGTGQPGQPNDTSIVLSFQTGANGARLNQTGDIVGALNSRPADPPTAPAWQPIWTGRQVLMWAGGALGTTYDPITDAWGSFPAGGLDPRTDGAAVWADGVLITWGGFPSGADSDSAALADGIIYRPAPRNG